MKEAETIITQEEALSLLQYIGYLEEICVTMGKDMLIEPEALDLAIRLRKIAGLKPS